MSQAAQEGKGQGLLLSFLGASSFLKANEDFKKVVINPEISKSAMAALVTLTMQSYTPLVKS